MNNFFCWYCSRPFEYDGEKYRDADCPHCGVMNTIIDPDRPVELPPENEEEEMAVNYNDEKYQGKFVYMPKLGETAAFDIKELREVQSENPKFNFSEEVPVMANGEQVVDDDGEPVFKKKDLGYHIEAELTNGKILSVTSIAAFRAVFKKNEIRDGEKIRVEHVSKGEWKVERI